MDGWKSPGGGMYRAPYGANNYQGNAKGMGDHHVLCSISVGMGMVLMITAKMNTACVVL